MEESAVSTKGHFPLKLIPFVSSSEKSVIKDSHSSSLFDTGFNGIEASKFYQSVISTPTLQQSQSPAQPCKNHEKKTKVVPCSSKNNFGNETIFRYAQEGDIKHIQKCITAGCCVDQQDIYGWTPLMCATCEGHSAVVEYLIKCGARLDIKCKHGMTAMDIAIKKNHVMIIQILQTGITPNEPLCSASSVKVKEEKKYCETCKLYYKVPTVTHERSIAHLFSTKKSELSTFYHIPENNKGFQLMLKSGWNKNKGLGLNADGRKFPIKTVLKKDRACIGKNKAVPKVTHFNANDSSAIKTSSHVPIKTVREKTLKKWQRKKLDEKNRQWEINFRRQFNSDF